MRAFLAIEIEESLKNKIKKTQQTIKNTNSAKIKYVEDENIHLTLKFFGEINQRKQKQISSIIRKTSQSWCFSKYESSTCYMDRNKRQ